MNFTSTLFNIFFPSFDEGYYKIYIFPIVVFDIGTIFFWTYFTILLEEIAIIYWTKKKDLHLFATLLTNKVLDPTKVKWHHALFFKIKDSKFQKRIKN